MQYVVGYREGRSVTFFAKVDTAIPSQHIFNCLLLLPTSVPVHNYLLSCLIYVCAHVDNTVTRNIVHEAYFTVQIHSV
jgi:hypothetical protein